jgi:hypothetical protein
MSTEKHAIRVHTDSGDHFVTEFNGTKEQIIEYYVGKTFNMGYCPVNEDRLEKCVRVEFLDNNGL